MYAIPHLFFYVRVDTTFYSSGSHNHCWGENGEIIYASIVKMTLEGVCGVILNVEKNLTMSVVSIRT